MSADPSVVTRQRASGYPYAVLLDRERWQLEARQRVLGDVERQHLAEAHRHERLAQARADTAARLGRAIEAGLDPLQARNRLAWLASLDARLRAQAIHLARAKAAVDQARAEVGRQQQRIDALEGHRSAYAHDRQQDARRRVDAAHDAAWIERLLLTDGAAADAGRREGESA